MAGSLSVTYDPTPTNTPTVTIPTSARLPPTVAFRRLIRKNSKALNFDHDYAAYALFGADVTADPGQRHRTIRAG